MLRKSILSFSLSYSSIHFVQKGLPVLAKTNISDTANGYMSSPYLFKNDNDVSFRIWISHGGHTLVDNSARMMDLKIDFKSIKFLFSQIL